MELNKLKKIRILGAGMFGTTYLVMVDNKKYALKIQHILPSYKKKNFKYELWRELDLYKYIDKLNNDDKKFVTTLHDYKIYDNCTHKQKRPFKVKNHETFAKLLHKLDKSKVCSYLLIDYHGKSTFGKYIATHNLTVKETYSFIFQLIKIIQIFYKGGYSHNDLHMDNVMIKKTNDKYFTFNNKKIPYYGYQLVAIDYGEVLHKKFKMKYNKFTENFKNKEKWFLDEIYNSTNLLITQFDKYMYNCTKQNKIKPWERKNFHPFDNLIRNIISNHNEFWKENKKEFIKDEESEQLINKIELNKNKQIGDIIKNKNKEYDVWVILGKISYKFAILHPKLNAKYFGWCSYHKINIPKDDYLQILKTNNYNQLLKFLYTKI